ncbi:hypothetical protein Tco_1283641 [Tanacetum coccineum]
MDDKILTMSGEDPLQNLTHEGIGDPREPEVEPTPIAHEAGGPSNTLLEQDAKDLIMQFLVHNFDRMNAMYKAFTQKLKNTPVLTSTDPPVIEPWNSDSDDMPVKAISYIFVESDNGDPSKVMPPPGQRPLPMRLKEDQW